MCKIFDWVFDSVYVEQAPQNHFEDPIQFNQDEDEDAGHDAFFDFFDTLGLLDPATPVEPPTPTPTFFEFEFASVICERHSSLSSSLSSRAKDVEYMSRAIQRRQLKLGQMKNHLFKSRGR